MKSEAKIQILIVLLLKVSQWTTLEARTCFLIKMPDNTQYGIPFSDLCHCTRVVPVDYRLFDALCLKGDLWIPDKPGLLIKRSNWKKDILDDLLQRKDLCGVTGHPQEVTSVNPTSGSLTSTMKHTTREVPSTSDHTTTETLSTTERITTERISTTTDPCDIDPPQIPSTPAPNSPFYRNCYEILQAVTDATSGAYYIFTQPLNEPVMVYCDMTTAGGGWLVFQRRRNGCADFFRKWEDYKSGFGVVWDEFWLGNQHLYDITSNAQYELRIDLKDFEGESRYAHYDQFKVEGETKNFRLSLGHYEGTAGDSLGYHGGQEFSTSEKDHDGRSDNCAALHKGGWWYDTCHASNLNGIYRRGDYTGLSNYEDGVVWQLWKGHWYSLKKTEMKIRPIQ